jgi:ATP-dependent Clp protease protease subunit
MNIVEVVLSKKKEKEKEKEVEPLSDEEIEKQLSEVLGELMPPEASPPDLRMVQLYGDIDEKSAADTVALMLLLKDAGKNELPSEDGDSTVITYDPFELLISTPGGTAVDMFAIYDTMRMIKDDCEIHTIGMGKVMSAGVLLLAAGTKGKRKIGANCRVMIHSVIGGHHGSIHNLENEMEEVRWVQEQHNKALVAETDLTPRMLKKLLSRNVNVYLTAKEAVEYGIADIII